MEITTQLYVEHIGQWRSWLENHHLTETEVWLVFDKKDAEKYQLDYIETVEEALCFGWIDGIKKKDGDRLLQRFTPRRTNSHWTELNKERVRRLMALGKMREQGIKVTPDLTVPFEIDHIIITELKKRSGHLSIFPDVAGALHPCQDQLYPGLQARQRGV